MKKIKVILICGLIGSVLGLSFLLFPSKKPIPNSPEEIVETLNSNGFEYEGQWIEKSEVDFNRFPDFHIKRKSDSRTWNELFHVMSPHMTKKHIIFVPRRKNRFISSPFESVRIGEYDIYGDPDEIQILIEGLHSQ